MRSDEQDREIGRIRRASAFGVHVFTACGAALALLAMLAAAGRDWAAMFAWLGLALLVDGVDGAFARRLDVKRAVPRWSGEVLDLVVDILTYVFVPAYAIAAGDLLPEPANVLAASLIVCTGVLYFADTHMKTADNYFLGFPATWNLVAFYLFLLRPAPWMCFVVVSVLCVLTFVPVPFLHPFRVSRAYTLNLVLLAAWCGLAVVAVVGGLAPAPWVVIGLCTVGLYFLCAGFFRGERRGGE
jgi:phosphatidylcholine synthase